MVLSADSAGCSHLDRGVVVFLDVDGGWRTPGEERTAEVVRRHAREKCRMV